MPLPRNNTLAPTFALPDQTGTVRSLDDIRGGQALVLLFFRGAFCATSRRDLLAWGDIHERISWLNARLVAVSVDAPGELARLKVTLDLPFDLFSDEDFSVSQSWGIYTSDEVEAGPQPHGEPGTFVIDQWGRIVFSQVQSGPKGAASPNEIMLMLLFMHQHGGRYWDTDASSAT